MPSSPSSFAAHAQIERLVGSVERVIFGKRLQVTLAVIGCLAEGHVLIEDVPGTGKTTLAKALARSLGLGFRRIQFTSDLLPSDVLGVSVYDAAGGDALKPFVGLTARQQSARFGGRPLTPDDDDDIEAFRASLS
jgi:MoxR-like ATPase